MDELSRRAFNSVQPGDDVEAENMPFIHWPERFAGTVESVTTGKLVTVIDRQRNLRVSAGRDTIRTFRITRAGVKQDG